MCLVEFLALITVRSHEVFSENAHYKRSTKLDIHCIDCSINAQNCVGTGHTPTQTYNYLITWVFMFATGGNLYGIKTNHFLPG